MKTLFFSVKIMIVLIFLANSPLFGQGGIISMTVNPQNPTTLDNIYVMADVWIPNSPCWMDSCNISRVGQTFYLRAYYNAGMLTVICNRTDSIGLGLIESGTFTLKYYLYYGPSTSTPAPKDSVTTTFTVSPMVGAGQNETGKDIMIYPNPAKDVLFVSSDIGNSQNDLVIELFTANGKSIFKSEMDSKETVHQFDITDWPSGLYFFQVSTGQLILKSGKIILIK